MHRCTNSCFGHRERQGSGCLCDTNASRYKLGLESMTGDEPELPGWIGYLAVVCFALCAAISSGYLDPLFRKF